MKEQTLLRRYDVCLALATVGGFDVVNIGLQLFRKGFA